MCHDVYLNLFTPYLPSTVWPQERFHHYDSANNDVMVNDVLDRCDYRPVRYHDKSCIFVKHWT